MTQYSQSTCIISSAVACKKKKKKIKRKNEKLKTKMFRKNSKCAYVYIANTDKDCDLLYDRPALS